MKTTFFVPSNMIGALTLNQIVASFGVQVEIHNYQNLFYLNSHVQCSFIHTQWGYVVHGYM